MRQLFNRYDFDQFLQLLDHLFDDAFISVNDDCHSGVVEVLCDTDRQAVDVKISSTEHTGDSHQYTGFVLHKN
jgi:hypothetical protein